MKPFHAPALGHGNLALAGLLVASGLFALALANPAAWLESGFETAINNRPASAGAVTVARAKWTPPVVGSEDYWLGEAATTSQNTLMQPAAWQGSVAKGDRFTISSGGGARDFEVISIEPVNGTASTVANTVTGGESALADAQVLVTCRAVGARHGETVRFLLNAGAPLPWTTTPANAHAL